MDSKQWVFIYQKIRTLIEKNKGRIPDNDISTQTMDLYVELMEITEKSRKDDPEMDDQLRNIMNYLFNIIHSLEVEKKVI